MPPDVLLAVWSLRILGVLALALLVVVAAWKLVELILGWLGVFNAFRLWFLQWAFWRARNEGRPQPHRCWCGHEHAELQLPKPASPDFGPVFPRTFRHR